VIDCSSFMVAFGNINTYYHCKHLRFCFRVFLLTLRAYNLARYTEKRLKSQSTSSSFVKSRKAEAPVYSTRIKPQGARRRTPLYRENHLKTGALIQLLLFTLLY